MIPLGLEPRAHALKGVALPTELRDHSRNASANIGTSIVYAIEKTFFFGILYHAFCVLLKNRNLNFFQYIENPLID